MIQCNRCGQQNQDGSTNCINCGNTLDNVQSNNQQLNNGNTQQGLYQSPLQNNYQQGYNQNMNMNGYQQPNNYNYQQPQKKGPNKVVIIVAIIVILLLLTCCIGGGFLIKKVVGGIKHIPDSPSNDDEYTYDYEDYDCGDGDDYDDYDDYDYDSDIIYESNTEKLLNIDNVIIETDISDMMYDKEAGTITLYVDASNNNRSKVNIEVNYAEVNGAALNVSSSNCYIELGSGTEYDGLSQYAYSEPITFTLKPGFDETLETIRIDFKLTSSDGMVIIAENSRVTGLTGSEPWVYEARKNYYDSDDSLDSDETEIGEDYTYDDSDTSSSGGENALGSDSADWLMDDYQEIGSDSLGYIKIPNMYVSTIVPNGTEGSVAYSSLGTDKTMIQLIPYGVDKDTAFDIVTEQLPAGIWESQDINGGKMLAIIEGDDTYPLVVMWFTDSPVSDEQCVVVALEFTNFSYENSVFSGYIIGSYTK